MAPRKKPAPRAYTDADKTTAIETLKTDGLAAAARTSGASKSTVIRWARAAGLNPADYANRSTAQNEAAAVAAVAARKLATIERRGRISDLLIGDLAPKAIAAIDRRLDEEAELDALVADAQTSLYNATVALEVLSAPPDPKDPLGPEERNAIAAARIDAREAVKSAALVLRTFQQARTKVPELVGVFTRSINDHLALDGDAADQAAASGTFTLIFTAPRPTPGALPPVVDLPAEAIRPKR